MKWCCFRSTLVHVGSMGMVLLGNKISETCLGDPDYWKIGELIERKCEIAWTKSPLFKQGCWYADNRLWILPNFEDSDKRPLKTCSFVWSVTILKCLSLKSLVWWRTVVFVFWFPRQLRMANPSFETNAYCSRKRRSPYDWITNFTRIQSSLW